MNNLKINTILSASYDEYFGFLQTEVDEMTVFYDVQGKGALIRKWYDGYMFGLKEVYNPWSVLNYIESVYVNSAALPAPYWANTSSNKIIRTLVERAALSTKDELEQLIGGGSIEKPIHEDITYGDMEASENNLWNFLFFTGYLKMCSQRLQGDAIYVTMAIPNTEVRYIYKNKILEWFRERIRGKDLRSFYDNKEAFYHGFLLGPAGTG